MHKSVKAHDLISEEDYNLLLGAKPKTPVLDPIPYNERSILFQKIVSEKIEYRYINGACEDRAHYIALLLKKEGVTAGKIWNFAPARYTYISTELFEIEDPFGITNTITWGYHVAPFIKAYTKKGEIETLIIDQSFSSDGYLTLNEWLQKMNCPRALQLRTDIDSYLFNSMDDFVLYEETTDAFQSNPTFVPSIITGNFWYLCPEDDFVQKGLSVNDLAVEMSTLKNTCSQKERDYLDYLLKNIDAIISFTLSEKPEELKKKTFDRLMQYYYSRIDHWNTRLEGLKS